MDKMKTAKVILYIANITSVILLINFLFINPSITGFVIKTSPDTATATNLAAIFIIVTFSLDVYFYMKSRKQVK